MAAITSAGIGSGIDINGLVKQLVDAEKKLPGDRMAIKEAELTAQLSSVGLLKGTLSTFQSKVNALRTPSGASGLQATVSDRNVLTTSVSSTAQAGQYKVEVRSLAQSHAVASKSFASSTSAVGTGVLTFDFGTTSYDEDGAYTGFSVNENKAQKQVTITNGTLEGIRDAVNNAKIGVTASIVNVGPEGYKLMFSGNDVGENNSLKISVSDADNNATNDAGLSQLAFNASAQNMTETQKAAHAELGYNGLTIKRASNKVDDLIKGVTLNLASTTEAGKSVTINVSEDVSALTTKAKSFVAAYNEMTTFISSQTAYDPKTGKGGIFLGDATVRSITTQMKKVIGDTIKVGNNNELSLASVGITSKDDGTLVLDEAMFKDAAEQNPDVVADLFAMKGNAQDEGLRYIGVSSKTQVGSYRVNITQPATKGMYTGGSVINDPTFTINASNNTLKVKIDGATSGDITIAQGSYGSADALATKIQAAINDDAGLKEAKVAVKVAIVNDKVVITSERYGSKSQAEVVSASGLGLAGGAKVDGLNVAGNFGSGAAQGDGQFLNGTTGDTQGLQIEYSGSASGVVGAVTVSRGFADQLHNLISGFLAEDGGIEGKTKSIQDGLINVAEQRVALDRRLLTLEMRWRKEFGAMDALVAQLQSTGNFLTQQLESLPQIQVK